MFNIDLTNNLAWVTGASRGIGRATALALGQAGCDVAVGFHQQETAATEVAEALASLGRRVLLVQGDVSDAAVCAGNFERIKNEFGRPVDILVNCAGIIRDNLFMMLETSDWEKVLNTNLHGVIHHTKIVIPDMMLKRRGRIINISSAAGMKSGRGQSNYAASKGAIEALTRSLAVELGGRGITVNALAPGVIETDMSREVVQLAKTEIMQRQVIKRLGRPEEIAAWVIFLASTYGDFLTGQTIAIDGGLKMP